MLRSLVLLLLGGLLLACASTTGTSEPPAVEGAWQLQSISGQPVIDQSMARLVFQAEGRLGGNASCNRISSSYQQQGSALSFGPLATTRMMCAPALMQQEQRLSAALPRVVSVKIENGLLLLADESGEPVIRAAPVKE